MSRIREAEKERVGDSQEFYEGGKWGKKGDYATMLNIGTIING